jgi:ABC-type proline/glycine betaine transport system substrate-binding protein
LQANEGEAAEADHSLGRDGRPRGTNGLPNRKGMVGPLLRLLKTSLLLLVAGVLAAGCGFGGGGNLKLGYLGWDENVANSYLTKVLLEAYALINAMSLDEEQVGSLELEINKVEDPETGVRRWLEERVNRELVQPWIEAAKKAQEE